MQKCCEFAWFADLSVGVPRKCIFVVYICLYVAQVEFFLLARRDKLLIVRVDAHLYIQPLIQLHLLLRWETR